MRVLFQKLGNLVGIISFPIVIRLLLIIWLVMGVVVCLWFNKKWSRIPEHKIVAHLTAEGLLSNKSRCNFSIIINAGTPQQIEDSLNKANIIRLIDDSSKTDYVNPNWINSGKCKYLYRLYPEHFQDKCTFYLLDYQCHTNINSIPYNDDKYAGQMIPKNHTVSYIEYPALTNDSTGTHAIGSGILAFDEYAGSGEMKFFTNLLNLSPSTKSLWDITQANYDIKFECTNIICDTISIEFVGATYFSDMYPSPDKITISSIEFTDLNSIKEIQKNGIRFHTEFIQMKEMSSRRNFVLTAVLSLFISFIASVIYKFLFGK